MDPTAFDRLTRFISASTSRRGALAALLGVLGTPLVPGSDAARRKTKGKNGRGKAKDKTEGKSKTKTKTKTRAAKQRTPDAHTEAARCCKRGSCTPGKGRNLGKCCYQGQDLTGKNFSGANLGQANFAGATLTKANLQGANAGKACFIDTILSNARINNSTNLSGAIFCRSTMPDGSINDSGCNKGTPCCPTCDADHPCGDGELCCNGRCIPGDCCDNGEQSTCGAGRICCDNQCTDGECCATADCPNETCQRRSCEQNQCIYEPVFGNPGPGCPTICCRDAQGDPECCPSADAICDLTTDACCRPPTHDETCGVGTAAPKCGEITDTCGQTIDCGPCAEKTCQDGSCSGEGNTCQYAPVKGTTGPGCDTLCCQDEAGEPICCEAGPTECTASGRCTCASEQDCASGEVCCTGRCVGGICCETEDCALKTCQQRSCDDHTCDYTPVFGATGPGCDDRVCCTDNQGAPACCPYGVTSCQRNETCGCLHTNECGDGAVCCNEQCEVGFCCTEQNCGPRICEDRACVDFDCNYTPVFGEDGPLCQTICCQDIVGEPVCCAEGVTTCQEGSGLCGCRINADCVGDALCCNGTCQPPTWTNQTTFGTRGADPNQFDDPDEVAVSPDGLTAWVADGQNDRIAVWTRPNATSTAWTNQTTFGSEGSDPSQLNFPNGVAVSPDTLTVWVSDWLNHRISVWRRPNASSTAWSNQTTFGAPGQFSIPRGVVVSADTLTLWVADAAAQRISVWTRPDAASTVWTNQTTFGSFGDEPSQFFSPSGLDVTPDGLTVLVADSGNNRISVWTRPNATSTAWANQDTFGASQFDSPWGVAVADDGLTAWVADRDNNRVWVWTRPNATSTVWTVQATLGTTGDGPSQFGLPVDVAVADDERTVWVADSNNNRISIWGLGCPAT